MTASATRMPGGKLAAAAILIAVTAGIPGIHGRGHRPPHKPPHHCVQVAPGWCAGGPPIITPGWPGRA